MQHELGVCWASHYGGWVRSSEIPVSWNSLITYIFHFVCIWICIHFLFLDIFLKLTYLFHIPTAAFPTCSPPTPSSHIHIHWVPHHATTPPSVFIQERAGLPCASTKHVRHLLLYSTWARLSSIRNRFPRAKVQGDNPAPIPRNPTNRRNYTTVTYTGQSHSGSLVVGSASSHKLSKLVGSPPMSLTSLVPTVPPPSPPQDSLSLAQCLAVGIWTYLHQSMDKGSWLTIGVVSSPITEDAWFMHLLLPGVFSGTISRNRL